MIVIDKVDGSKIDSVVIDRVFAPSKAADPVPLVTFDGTDAHGVEFSVTLDIKTAMVLGQILVKTDAAIRRNTGKPRIEFKW